MEKIGRNDLCPCGSGKKYKKCCMKKIKSDEHDVINENVEFMDDLARLESLSNDVVTFIENKQYENAEKNCRMLMKDYPDQVDGLMRFAELHDAKGEISKAIEYYKRTIEFMKTHPGFEQESISSIVEEINKLNV